MLLLAITHSTDITRMNLGVIRAGVPLLDSTKSERPAMTVVQCQEMIGKHTASQYLNNW